MNASEAPVKNDLSFFLFIRHGLLNPRKRVTTQLFSLFLHQDEVCLVQEGHILCILLVLSSRAFVRRLGGVSGMGR